jgi:hypothetical protein
LILEDLVGKRFGRLLVTERCKNYVSPKGQTKSSWICNCDCGNSLSATSSNLKQGYVTSCGCYRYEQLSSRKKDISKKRFGRILVLNKVSDSVQPSGQHKTQYLCKCDCGNIIIISAYRLRNGETTSCGCRKESRVATELKKYLVEKYNATLEYKICRNPKTKHYLPFDIYLSKNNTGLPRDIFIEVHGIQHYEMNSKFHKSVEDLKSSKRRDKIKKKYADEHGTYIEIDLRRISTVSEAIKYMENTIDEKILL